MSHELQAFLSANSVVDSWHAFLTSNGVTSIADYVCCVSSEAGVDAELIVAFEALGEGNKLGFGAKAKIRHSWLAARESLAVVAAPGAASSSAAAKPEGMPDGSEDLLLTAWEEQHKFHLPGSQLVASKLMGRMYGALNAKRRTLYVPMT